MRYYEYEDVWPGEARWREKLCKIRDLIQPQFTNPLVTGCFHRFMMGYQSLNQRPFLGIAEVITTKILWIPVREERYLLTIHETRLEDWRGATYVVHDESIRRVVNEVLRKGYFPPFPS